MTKFHLLREDESQDIPLSNGHSNFISQVCFTKANDNLRNIKFHLFSVLLYCCCVAARGWHGKVQLNKSKHFHLSDLKHYFVKCNLFKAMWQIQVYCKYMWLFFVLEFFEVKTIKYPKVGPKVSHRLPQVRREEWLHFCQCNSKACGCC